jgi:hypothetical protein
MKWLRSQLIPLTVLIAITLTAYGFHGYARRYRVVRGYLAAQEGDSEQTVIARLGQPDRVSKCFHPDVEDESDKKCSEMFRFYSFLESWEFYFDKDGKLIFKSYSVSY